MALIDNKGEISIQNVDSEKMSSEKVQTLQLRSPNVLSANLNCVGTVLTAALVVPGNQKSLQFEKMRKNLFSQEWVLV